MAYLRPDIHVAGAPLLAMMAAMKLALVSSALFLLSYLAVNRGLVPQPVLVIVPLLVVIGTTGAAHWLIGRGRRGRSSGKAAAQFAAKMGLDPDRPQAEAPMPRAPLPPSPLPPSPPRGGKARKLF